MNIKTEKEAIGGIASPGRDLFKAVFLHPWAEPELMRDRRRAAPITEANGSPDEANMLWDEDIVDVRVNGKERQQQFMVFEYIDPTGPEWLRVRRASAGWRGRRGRLPAGESLEAH